MRHRTKMILALLGALALTGCGAARHTLRLSLVYPLPASNYVDEPACLPRSTRCNIYEYVPITPTAKARHHPIGAPVRVRLHGAAEEPELKPSEGADGFTPAELVKAYKLETGRVSQATEESETIGVLGETDYPWIEEGLKVYSEEMGIAQCTEASGCLKQIRENGTVAPPPRNQAQLEEAKHSRSAAIRERLAYMENEGSSWEFRKETPMDVEIVHGLCPHCKILLGYMSGPIGGGRIEFKELDRTINAMVEKGATIVTSSEGGSEVATNSESETVAKTATEKAEAIEDAEKYLKHAKTVILEAAGDYGFERAGKCSPCRTEKKGGVNYVGSTPWTISVGASEIKLNASGERLSERPWASTGSGCSYMFSAPSWQASLGNWPSQGCGTSRETTDVMALGAGESSWSTYFPIEKKWGSDNGTSESAPIIAGIWALAGGANGVEWPAESLYKNIGDFYKPTSGSNGYCEGHFVCSVSSGAYNGVSGVGAPTTVEGFK